MKNTPNMKIVAPIWRPQIFFKRSNWGCIGKGIIKGNWKKNLNVNSHSLLIQQISLYIFLVVWILLKILKARSRFLMVHELLIQCVVILIKEFLYNTLIHILDHKETQGLKVSKILTKLLLTQLILSENSSSHHLLWYLFTR